MSLSFNDSYRCLNFLSHPHTNNGYHQIPHFIHVIGKTWKRLPENPKYAEMRHGDVILTLQWRHRSTCDQRAANVRLFFFILPTGWYGCARSNYLTWVKTTEISICCARNCVLCLFSAVSWVGLWSVIVAFLCNAHLFLHVMYLK